MRCGLLGRKLGHSYSPLIHHYLADYSYELFEREPDELESFLRHGEFSGLNVTVPYKKDVIPFLDELTPIAKQLGAVNTIVRRNGKLIGHNTDYFGFETMVRASGLAVCGKKTLVLGSGGASRTAAAVLQEMGAEVIVISRTGPNNYRNLHLHQSASLIVNTTPVGMYPETGISPLCLDDFPFLEGVLDVIYNPARTQLLLDACKRGIPAINGLLMLVAQAKEAAQWFTQETVSNEKIQEIYRLLSAQMQNIILIGMPGCGKSTVGKLLAQSLGRQFADADEQVVSLAGSTVADIFADHGENTFRQWETAALSQLGKKSGIVLATGGGCVTRQHNYPLLHQNGIIFWLQRQTALLPADGRPLSQAGSLEAMYQRRKAQYADFADHIIDNNAAPEDAVAAILSILEEIS